MVDDPKEFRREFLKANANPEFIAGQFADVLRNLMRAIAATSDYSSGGVYEAARFMRYVDELIQHSPEKIDMHQVFRLAVRDIRGERPDDEEEEDIDRRRIQVARSATRFLVESSCRDNASRGRSSKRWGEFERELRWLEEAQAERLMPRESE